MGVKIKYTDPTFSSFATDDIIINVDKGSLFFKSNTKVYKLQGDDQSLTDTSDSLEITGLINSIGSLYQIEIDGNHGSGPRINMGTSKFHPNLPDDSDAFMSLGAYNGINQLDTKDRDFHLYGTNTTTGLYFDESVGNVGIGTITPGAALEIVDPTTNIPTLILGRKAGYPTIKTSGGTGHMIIDSGGDYISLNHYTSEDVALGYGGGNVGVGIVTPLAPLHIYKEVADTTVLTEMMRLERQILGTWDMSTSAQAEGGYIALHVEDSNNGGELARISWQGDNANNYEGDGRLGFWTAKSTGASMAGYAITEQMTITRDGKVGIGVTTPSHLLSINTETVLGGTIGDELNLLSLQCETSNTQNLTINALRTSTGTSWTSAGIRIQSKVDSTYQAFIDFNGEGGSHGLAFGAGSSTGNPEDITKAMTIDDSNYVNVNTIMRLKSSTDGRDGFYLGTSTQPGMAGQFQTLDGTDLQATALATGGVLRNIIYFYDSPGSSDTGRIVHETSGVNVSGGTDFRNKSTIHLCPSDDAGHYDYVSVHGFDETEVIKLRTSGDIDYSGVLTDTSDRRIKKNINPLSGSLSKILQLRGVSFNWKDEKKSKEQIHGLIAQEVREVIPEIVREMSKYPDEKDPTLGITYIDLIPFLIESIKDQQKQIDELKNQLNG